MACHAPGIQEGIDPAGSLYHYFIPLPISHYARLRLGALVWLVFATKVVRSNLFVVICVFCAADLRRVCEDVLHACTEPRGWARTEGRNGRMGFV